MRKKSDVPLPLTSLADGGNEAFVVEHDSPITQRHLARKPVEKSHETLVRRKETPTPKKIKPAKSQVSKTERKVVIKQQVKKSQPVKKTKSSKKIFGY